MITIKDLAYDLEVTRQTVYNHIKENDKELKACIFKQKGVTVINDAGVRIIKESMGLIKVPVVQEKEIGIEEIIKEISGSIEENINKNLHENMQELKQDIKEDYAKLENELAEVKEQNAKLIELIQQQNEEKKKGFWSRLLNK